MRFHDGLQASYKSFSRLLFLFLERFTQQAKGEAAAPQSIPLRIALYFLPLLLAFFLPFLSLFYRAYHPLKEEPLEEGRLHLPPIDHLHCLSRQFHQLCNYWYSHHGANRPPEEARR